MSRLIDDLPSIVYYYINQIKHNLLNSLPSFLVAIRATQPYSKCSNPTVFVFADCLLVLLVAYLLLFLQACSVFIAGGLALTPLLPVRPQPRHLLCAQELQLHS